MNPRDLIALLVLLLGATSTAGAEAERKESIINYQLPRAGQVSLAVYDQQGHQLRTLLAGEPRAAGKHTASWDGLDRLGSPMPVGAYTWKLLMNNGLEADYVSVIGQNVIDPAEPWVPMVGNHQGPSSVALGAGGDAVSRLSQCRRAAGGDETGFRDGAGSLDTILADQGTDRYGGDRQEPVPFNLE